MKMFVYMKVTKDKYELPIAVANTVRELAAILGISENCISSSMSHERAGKSISPYKKIEIEEEDEV